MANNDTLPEGYVEGVSRVSNVVSHMFPFKGTYAEGQFISWLMDRVPPSRKRGFHILPVDYMKEASDVGTFIHLQMEKKILMDSLDYTDDLYLEHLEEIMGGLDYIDDLQEKYPDVKWETEVVVKDEHDRFQGSIDLIRVDESTKTVWLYDWKTWGIAKKKWKLPNNAVDHKGTYKKDAGKLKKVALQLSLYAETYRQKGYKIGGIFVVHLHKDGCFEIGLRAKDHPKQRGNDIRLWTTDELDELLSSYMAQSMKLPPDINLTIKYKPMRITIQTPAKGVDFSRIELTLEAEDCNNGKTAEQNIGEAVRLQKIALDSYEKS